MKKFRITKKFVLFKKEKYKSTYKIEIRKRFLGIGYWSKFEFKSIGYSEPLFGYSNYTKVKNYLRDCMLRKNEDCFSIQVSKRVSTYPKMP